MFKKFRQLLSIVLVLTLVFNMLPVQCFSLGEENLVDSMTESDIIEADDASASADAEEILSAQVVGEDVSRRDEFYKEFVMDNGLRLASVYPEAVHFEKDGAWEDIDNTLVAATQDGVAGYSNTAGVWNVHFPAQLSGANVISVTKDGYTVSFGMAGALRSDGGLVVASIENELGTQAIGGSSTLTAATAQLSTAQIQAVDTSAMKAEMDHPEIVQDKLYSRLSYPTVYSGTNVVYDLSGNRLKESVILSAYDDGLWGYRYSLDTGDLVAVLNDDQSIDLVDAGGEVVLHMPAPFLVDDAGEYCYDIDVALTQSGDGYTLAYYLPRTWLAEADRAWPVVLDPVVQADTTRSNIRDASIYELGAPSDYDNNYGVLDVGHNTNYGIMRSLLKYDVLPSLTSADMVVYAQLQLYKPNDHSTTNAVQVHKVLSTTWTSEGVTWSNQPSFDETVEDFAIVQNAGTYHWDVTEVVRGWYEDGNSGLMLKAPNWVENTTSTSSYRKQFCSSDYGEAVRPILAIVFRNNNGLESCWDYTTTSAGRAGTGYVNDYTGNLVWVHSDMGFGGNRMPVSISHIYNANDSQKNSFGLGYGWRTNYNQRVYHWDEGAALGDYYVWEDADGTFHYFLKESTGVYKDEDGLELTLQTSGFDMDGASIAIFDKSGSASYFDSQGRLFKLANGQVNDQAETSYITFTYLSSDSLKISTITDGAGRVYSFIYSGGLLSKIQFKGTGSTALSTVFFYYEDSTLTQIQDPDAKRVTYSYTGNALLSTVLDVDGYMLTYGYSSTSTGVPNRINSIAESDGTASGSSLTVEYGKNQTKFTDTTVEDKPVVQIKQFNNWGNTISIQDDQGHAQYAKYANNDPQNDATNKGNQLKLSSKLQETVSNRMPNSNFENTVDWTATSNASVSNVTGTSYLGSRSMKVVTSTTATAGQGAYKTFTVTSGKTYTFSAYVKTLSSASAYLSISDGTTTETSEVLAKSTNWTRLEVSITAASTTLTVRVLTTNAGQFYIDCAQLEQSVTASRYNLVENGDFRYTTNWSDTTRVQYSPGAPQLDNNCFKLAGSLTGTKRVSQTVSVSGNAGDVFVLAGWALGYSVPLTEEENADGEVIRRRFGLVVNFLSGDTVQSTQSIQFNPSVEGWQYASGVIVADQAYDGIKIQLAYDYNANVAWFDGIQLYKEEFGHSYVYDDDGNVISVTDLQKKTTTYEYKNNDLTKAILPTGAELSYEYDGNHNVTEATSQTGVVYEFTYDAWGNNTSVSIVNGDEKITTTATYTTNGNYLLNTKDAAGYLTRYGYNEQTGVLNWVQYPEDTADTRTEYTYDSMYRMASAAATTDTGLGMSASYTYTDDLLTKIQTPSTAYSFTYGDFALRNTVKAGNTTLATYTYTTDGNNYLDRLTYGNNDYVDYTYDELGRVIQDTYEDGDTVKYQYDNSGALATVVDSESGITSTYYYDLIDRLCKYKEAGTNYSIILEYGFNEMNNVSSVKENIDGNSRTTSYAYDEDNRVSSISKGGFTETYTYDAYSRIKNRVTTQDGDGRLTEELTYRTNSAGNATNQVDTMTITSNGDYSTYFVYSYDMNGNIVSVRSKNKTTSYVYDSANQLIRENNEALRIICFPEKSKQRSFVAPQKWLQ
ncbi:MAG: DNRLRE domain-containing protein [Oscillospiraceae bacterium]|nr:DNRLRE domain-containing protein [Oscillospiraceae bacterium]